MATRAAVELQALQMLGVVESGGTASTDDDAIITQSFAEAYQQLEELGIASWAVADSVPDDIVPHIKAMTAYGRIDLFGVPEPKYSKIEAKAINAPREIRLLTTPPYESLEEPEDF